MASAFTRYLSTIQGRIQPHGAVASAGAYVFCLGADLPGRFDRLVLNDEIRLSQNADITGLKLITFTATIRGPVVNPTTARSDATGLIVASAAQWQLLWGVGTAVHGRRTILPGKTVTIRDAVIDVSQLAGVQNLRITLRLIAGP